MVTICIIVMFFSVFLNWYRKKSWISLLTIFVAIWTMILCFSKLQWYDMVSVSQKIYNIVCIGCMMFVVGYTISSYLKIRFVFSKNKSNYLRHPKYEINSKVLLVILIIVFVFESFIGIRVAGVLLSGGSFNLIHDMAGGYAETALLNSAFESYMDVLVIMPCVFSVIPISLIMLFDKRIKYKWLLFSLFAADLFLYILVHGGRVAILYIVVDIILLYYLYGHKMKRKTKRKIIIAVLAAITVVVFLTLIRKGVSAGDKSAGEAVGSSIYKYFSASMPLMDYWVDVIDEQQFQSYGMAFLHGVLNFFDIFLSKIGISFDLLNQTSFYIGQTESTFLYGLYDHGSFNAFVSVFYFFYMDFRWVGVIVGSLFFGFFCHRVERLANKNNLLNSALYLLIAQSVLKSFGRWEFYLTSYCLSFLFLRICFKRKMISDKTEGGENYGT